MEYKTGDRLCSCTLIRKCGKGSYGEVWLAEDSIGTHVALKIIYNRGTYSERELNGLKNYKDCNHPNLLKIRYVEITDERLCCIMDAADDLNHGQGEYLPDTLANRLNKFGRMDGKEITAMLDGLLAGLEELHKHGLVHRDIKPDNILWVNGRPTLADVGLITLEGKGSLVGTPGFMSPKLLSGKGQADASDDFYALGKVIYCALTGLPVGEYPSIPENMTISMDASLGHALRESCKQPIRSAAEFRKLLQGKSIPAPKSTKPNTRIRKLPIVPILLLLAVCGILWLLGTMVKNRSGITSEEKEMLKKLLDYQKKADAEWRREAAEQRKAAAERKMVDAELKRVAAKQKKAAAELDATLKEASARMAEAKAKMQAQVKKANTERYGAAGADYLEKIQERTVKFFRKTGLLPGNGNVVRPLINYHVMNRKEIMEVLLRSNRNPRLVPEGVHPRRSPHIRVTETERELHELFKAAYPDFDIKEVKFQQKKWQESPGPAILLQRQLLATDKTMQALTLDSIIRSRVNDILKNGAFKPGEKSQLAELFELRHGLLKPEEGKLAVLAEFR